MTTRQERSAHPLASLGYRKPPHWLWRFSRRLWIIAAATLDIWMIVTGRLTLHRAWQAGYDRRCSEFFAQSRRVRNFSAPDDVFEAVPTRFIKNFDEQSVATGQQGGSERADALAELAKLDADLILGDSDDHD